MLVRMIGGVNAGEIMNLPFIAARGAIGNGLAKELVAEPDVLTTTLAEAAVYREDERPQGKRHGKRR